MEARNGKAFMSSHLEVKWVEKGVKFHHHLLTVVKSSIISFLSSKHTPLTPWKPSTLGFPFCEPNYHHWFFMQTHSLTKIHVSNHRKFPSCDPKLPSICLISSPVQCSSCNCCMPSSSHYLNTNSSNFYTHKEAKIRDSLGYFRLGFGLFCLGFVLESHEKRLGDWGDLTFMIAMEAGGWPLIPFFGCVGCWP